MIIFKKINDVLFFTMSGKITDEDYKKVIIQEIEKEKEILKDSEKLKLAIVLSDDFQGVSIKVVIDDIIYGFKNRNNFYKIGISGKYYKIQDQLVKLANTMVSGEMKVYDDSEDMFKWLK